MKFIRNQLTSIEIDQLRAAWQALDKASFRYNAASPHDPQITEYAAAANAAEDKLHALWRSHGWEDRPTWEIGIRLITEGIF